MKIPRYLILIIIPAAALIIYLGREHSRTGGRKPQIIAGNVSGIDGIDIIKGLDTARYIRDDEGAWFTNEGFKVEAGLIAEALTYLEVISPVSGNISDSIASLIDAEGTCIRLYEGNRLTGNIRLLFFTKGIKGTYLVSGHNPRPWLIRVRNYMTDNAEAFILGLNKKISGSYFYGFSSGNLSRVKITYPDRPEDSFIITLENGNPRLYKYTGDSLPSAYINLERISDYMAFYGDLKSVYTQRAAVNILPGPHFASMELTAVTGETLKLDAYRNITLQGTGFDMTSFTGVVNTTDTLILDYTQLDPFFRKAGDFLKNP